jgi:hypothetical protein
MAAEITQIDTQNFTTQTYDGQDTNLLSSFDVNTSFTTGSYIEYFTYDNNQNLLSSDYNFTQYTIQNDGQSAGNGGEISEIILDPEQTLINNGFDQGEYITYFNFFNKQIGSQLQQLYITELSSDRTEIRLDSTSLTNIDIIEQTNMFIQEREDSTYFLDFYLNFGENQLTIANNVELDVLDPNNPTILIKLYEPLPDQYNLNSTLWIVTSVEESRAYKVTFEETPIIINDTTEIKGPNFNLDLKDQVNNSTVELSYIDLLTTSLTSSQNQLNSLLEEKEIDINIDYTNFDNFIHFSSVQTRLENFYYKIQLIEQYSSSIAVLNSTTNSSSSISSSTAVYESKIDNIITNFDGYEYYLYYETGSTTWPKTNTQKPYTLASSTSPTVLTWIGSSDETNAYYGGMLLSASVYDNDNINNLYFTIPEYLREDSNNDQYLLFINMIGQFYDNIWIYYKDVTQKYNADNRLEYGISKDIVADAIRDFGIKLYQNNFSNQDLYTAFLGITPEGGLFPFPNITGSLPTPSGFEYVDTLISASNDYLPLDDVNKSLYKRIYHNLPYLLKSKGTLPGLRALITSYGIPDTILRINEFGGKDKVNSNDWDLWQDEFNYAFDTKGNNYVYSTWSMDPLWDSEDNVPSTLEFRFKTNDSPQNNIPLSQSIWNLSNTFISLRYEGTGYISGSYSGSIIDPYYQYAYLDFYPDINNLTQTASVYLPFYNNDWWSVMVTRNNDDFNLYVGNKIYEGGENNTELGFYSSSFISYDSTEWSYPDQDSVFGKPYTLLSDLYPNFSGSYQEIRYYSIPLSESVFKDYIMNPYSIEGNSLNSSPNELMFRASLGGELYTESISIHPKVTGSWQITQSFSTGDSTFQFHSTPTYSPNTEFFFVDQPVAGIKNIISDKIRVENNVLPSGDTLSQYRALSQQANISQSYTPNINYLEVAFSPQNEINEDIMDQIGYFNIGEYIGDPRLRSSSAVTYPALDQLRNEYFQKYTKNYNLVDFIRLIKFFDNSLFKMIKDFVPARTSLAAGIVIKQNLLERNKYPQPQVSWEDLDISGTLNPTWNDYQPGTVEHFEGGTGGSFERFNLATNTLQSWTESINTISGSVLIIHDSQDEFYNGEFSGSNITVTTQILNPAYPVSNKVFSYKQIYYYGTGSNEENIFENLFLNNYTSPHEGEILFMENSIYLFNTWGPIYRPKYLKIAKIDCNGNDNTISLGQLDKIMINTPIQSQGDVWLTYDVTVLNESSNYYLYSVTSAKLANQPIPYTPPAYPNQVLDYYVSSSITSSQQIPPISLVLFDYTNGKLDSWDSTLGNTPHYNTQYFNTSSGYYTLENTPNTPFSITASIITSGSIGGSFTLSKINQGVYSVIATSNYPAGTNINTTISASYYGLNGDEIYLRVVKSISIPTTSSTLISSNLLITQSRVISSSNCLPSIFVEPYIEIANFYNSDENALINNVESIRQNTLLQDIDYSSGITTPVNFAALISGSATKATIPDSNYTTKRHIIPRYLGSRSTSQQLNTWTSGDTGTYGKLPSVESLKTVVAYSPSIGGWPPEHMNASAIFVTYLIDQNGNVGIPNTSENSLANIQQSFQNGERVRISTQTQGGGDSSEYRTILRGGTRIEPILYTQSGSAPNAQWNTTMSFEDITPSNIGAVGNYTALYYHNPSVNASPGWSKCILDNTSYGTPVVNNDYTASSAVIEDGVNLIVNGSTIFYNSSLANPLTAGLRIVKERGVNKTYYPNSSGIYHSVSPNQSYNLTSLTPQGYTIPVSDIVAGDIIYLEVYSPNNNLFISNTQLRINQFPNPTSPITSSGVNSIWGFPDPVNYPYVITSSNPTLSDVYDVQIKQTNISGSGFNPINLQWSLEYGDEFRFEGREDFVFEVGKAYGPNEGIGERLFQTGSIEVHFNASLPVSSSQSTPSTCNLDHFIIRRYVDDASQILIEGFRPNNTTGPYIVTPEYITPSLNKNVDSFITDLTQKGLL